MKKHWPLLAGIVLLAAGSLLAWQDVGSPSTANVLQAIGVGLAAWHLLRLCGG